MRRVNMLFDASRLRLFEVVNNIKPSNYFKRFQTIFQNPRQSYNFFLTFHSQIVQFYSQIVQIFLFSSQLVPIGQKKVKKKQKTVATNVTTEIGGEYKNPNSQRGMRFL